MNIRLLTGIVVAVALAIAGCSSSSGDPASVLEDYEAARTAGDVDALIALYANDAVVLDHPLDDDGIAQGVDEIRALEAQVPGIQGSTGFTEFRNMEVSGDIVTFNQKFVVSDGECFSNVGVKVTVVDAEITQYDWGTGEGEDQCG